MRKEEIRSLMRLIQEWAMKNWRDDFSDSEAAEKANERMIQ
jgi:hypothetical protein